MSYDDVLKIHGFILEISMDCDTWIHPHTRMIIVVPKNNEPYILHPTLDPNMDHFDSPEEMDRYLKRELVSEILHA